MRKAAIVLLLLFCSLHSCRKDEAAKTSGVATIDNKLVFDNTRKTYIGYGFLFSKAGLVSNLDNPKPDITVYTDGLNLSFQTEINGSFAKTGEYTDAAAAKAAFDKLTSANITLWEGSASPVKANQIWIYKSGSEHYAKIRVISVTSEVRNSIDYADCTFEWVYQPDGTLTFP